MEQNTESWHAWRQQGLGASDAPIIMGESKYMSAQELFLEKTGQAPPKPVNEFITNLGHKFEPRARAYYNLMVDAEFEPQVVQMEEYDWLRASLDGLYGEQPLEVKYVGQAKLDAARAGNVELSHWIQMQHQMMVTGAMSCIYLCYTLDKAYKRIDEIHYHQVSYDDQYVQKKLWPRLFDFWSRVCEWRSMNEKS